MPKNLGLYNNDLAVPRKQDIDNVQNELDQLTEDVDLHIGNVSNPHEVTKSQVGLGNVDNVKQYSASNPPPYPVASVNGKNGEVDLTASDVEALPISGGTMGGDLDMNHHTLKFRDDDGNVKIDINREYLIFLDSSGNGGTVLQDESPGELEPVLGFYGGSGDQLVKLNNIADPTSDIQAANKRYVDNAIASAGGVDIKVQSTQPVGQSVGDFWYQII